MHLQLTPGMSSSVEPGSLRPESASVANGYNSDFFSLVRRPGRNRPEASSVGSAARKGEGTNADTTGGDAQGDVG